MRSKAAIKYVGEIDTVKAVSKVYYVLLFDPLLGLRLYFLLIEFVADLFPGLFEKENNYFSSIGKNELFLNKILRTHLAVILISDQNSVQLKNI